MAERTECTIEGCHKPNVGRGWCATHYQRWQATGDPLMTRTARRVATRVSRPCDVDGCEEATHARGFCKRHYLTWYKGGHPHAPVFRTPPPLERFWMKVDRTDGCWLWTGGTNGCGYGQFQAIRRVPVGAHRYAYEVAYGPIPEGLEVDHLCRVTLCVRPSHLEAVTPDENKRRARA